MNSWPTIANVPPPLGSGGILPNGTRVIIIYPTVDPTVVVVPIVSSIFLFPIIVFLVICWLRKMAAKRRQRARLAHRDDFWNERSCASIVQRSPPLSISLGNGYSGARADLTTELVSATLDVEMLVGASYLNHNVIVPTPLSSPNNNAERVEDPATPDLDLDPDLTPRDEEESSISSS